MINDETAKVIDDPDDIKFLKKVAPDAKKKFVGRHEEMMSKKSKKESNELINYLFQITSSDKKQAEKISIVSEILKDYFLDNYHIYTIRESKAVEPEMWIYKEGIYIPCGETYIKEKIMEILGNKFGNSYVNNTLTKLQVTTYISLDEFFKEDDEYILPVANGLLNVKTLKKEEFDPEKRFFSKINAMYLPTADCPKIKKFISEIVRKQDIPLIQEMFGFCLVRKYFLKKAYMLLGKTDAGKSKLLQLLHTFLDYKNCSSVPLHQLMEENFMLWKLHGKLANISADISNKSILSDALFKRLVGEDPLTADRKWKEAIEFFNYAKILNACNDLPKTYTYDNAFFNRWILIKFPNQFKIKKEYTVLSKKEREEEHIYLAKPNILETIIDINELNGLLIWALEGLKRLIKKGEFSYNKTAEEIKLEWLKDSNSFEAFFYDTMEETKTYDFHETKEEVKNLYKNYCKEHKLKIESDKVIKNTLEREHGAYDKKVSYHEDDDVPAIRIMVWAGVRFKENGEEL